jgi:hypothetical protein
MPYISYAYGSLLAHERRITQRKNDCKNRVQLDVNIASHNKGKDQTKLNYNPNIYKDESLFLSLSLS